MQENNHGVADAQALMSPRAILGLVIEGVRSNFWGLGCPSYCTAPSVGLLGFLLLFGWILGFASALLILFWLSGLGLISFGFPRPLAPSLSGFAPAPSANRNQLLSAYLDEPTSRPSRRR